MIYLLLVSVIVIQGITTLKLIKERNEYRKGYEWTTRKFSEYVENTLEYIETLKEK